MKSNDTLDIPKDPQQQASDRAANGSATGVGATEDDIWSGVATDGNDEGLEYRGMEYVATYQLNIWAHETNRGSITFAEILEKSK